MDYNAIAAIIGSLGFPIVACGAMFWMMNTTMKEFKETVAENTKAMTELVTTVKTLSGRGDEDV